MVLVNPLRRVAGTLAVVGILAAFAPLALAESTKVAEAAGATLFRDKGCSYCHGANTQGTPKGPSLINVRKRKTAQQIADQIKNGGQKMPSFDDSLSAEEINQLVAYLRAKHRPAPVPAQPQAPKPTPSE